MAVLSSRSRALAASSFSSFIWANSSRSARVVTRLGVGAPRAPPAAAANCPAMSACASAMSCERPGLPSRSIMDAVWVSSAPTGDTPSCEGEPVSTLSSSGTEKEADSSSASALPAPCSGSTLITSCPSSASSTARRSATQLLLRGLAPPPTALPSPRPSSPASTESQKACSATKATCLRMLSEAPWGPCLCSSCMSSAGSSLSGSSTTAASLAKFHTPIRSASASCQPGLYSISCTIASLLIPPRESRATAHVGLRPPVSSIVC
mmetsp:Transcript_14719/g.37809  ORF Transcript_14719/g.37809 Transcript_14719/m.37809 type:complete len:265 (-) Transcript_14719:1684-2478(-)